MIKEILVEKLITEDSKRARTTQVNVGPSEIGGCQRRLWYRLNAVKPTNTGTSRLAAIMGTSIHTAIEVAFSGDENYLTEVELTHNGLTGHVDLLDVQGKTIWDWKTITKAGSGFFGNEGQIAQLQVYGWLANNCGYEITTLGLVGIPRDGNENDIIEVTCAYDEDKALAYLARLENVKTSFAIPEPEKEQSFCKRFCEFYGTCDGLPENTQQEITNDEVIQLLVQYKSLQEQSKKVGQELDFLKEALKGTTGVTPQGISIKWSQLAGRQSVDEEAVQKLLGYVPKKQGNGYERLTIK